MPNSVSLLRSVQTTKVAQRRGQIEILLEILGIASKGGTSKTSLAQRSGLSFRRFEKYLELLEAQGLLESCEVDGIVTSIYRTTEKGYAARKTLLEAQKLILGVCDS